MAHKRNRFTRPLGNRRYKRLFVIGTEGEKTEPEYFSMLNDYKALVFVKCLKGNRGSSPLRVLKRMKNFLTRENLLPNDEAWLVVDKDNWNDDQLGQLLDWTKKSEKYGLAVSNPMFEFWLLLHFEDGNNIRGSKDVMTRLKRHLPEYEKGIHSAKFTQDMILAAVNRAAKRDTPPCAGWPESTGSTTVYRLVDKIIKF